MRDFDIEIGRQEDWFKELRLMDGEGAPIDLTGYSFLWRARLIAGAGAVIATATVALVDATDGAITAHWHGPDFDGVAGTTEIVRIAHDLKTIAPDGLVDVPLRGHIILRPEVTA